MGDLLVPAGLAGYRWLSLGAVQKVARGPVVYVQRKHTYAGVRGRLAAPRTAKLLLF